MKLSIIIQNKTEDLGEDEDLVNCYLKPSHLVWDKFILDSILNSNKAFFQKLTRGKIHTLKKWSSNLIYKFHN